MSTYSVINLKTDPELKKKATRTAQKLGVSISALLNNELRRFATEQSVTFSIPETPNEETDKLMKASNKEIISGNYHKFKNNKAAIDFLSKELK